MADSDSLSSLKLEEPGWPKLDSGVPDFGASFASAFAKAAAVKNQSLDLQQRIAEMNMHMVTSQQEHDIQMKKLALDTANTMADNNRADKEYNWKTYYEEANLERQSDAAQKKADDADKLDQEKYNFQNGLAAIEPLKGTAEYEQKLAELQAQYPNGANTKTGLLAYKMAGEQHNLAVRRAVDLNNTGWKSLQQETGTLLWNDKNNPDMWPLFDDKLFQDVSQKQQSGKYDPKDPTKHPITPKYEVQTDDQGNPILDKHGQPQRQLDASGKKIPKTSENFVAIPQYDQTGKALPPKRIAIDQLQNLKQRYQQLVDDRNKIPGQINNSNVQARATDSSFNQPTEYQTWQQGMRDPSLTPDERAKLEKVGRSKGWF